MRPARLLALIASLALSAGLALASCGGSSQTPALAGAIHGSGRPCPGASSCPYAKVMSLGRRGSNVMRYPEAIAVGREGDVYVGDQYSHVIQVFSPEGRFLRQWGSYGSKPGQLGAVGGVAAGPEGDIYVLDSSNDRVERFTSTGRLLTEFGRPGSGLGQMRIGAGEGPDKPPGGGIAVGGGHVYVADTMNDRIERFTLSGGEPKVLVGAGRAPGQVISPHGLAVTAHALYVADDGNRRVDELTLSGRPIAMVSQFPSVVSRFEDPYDVAVSGKDVYVVDDNHARLVVFTEGLSYLRNFGGGGDRKMQLSMYLRAVAGGREGNLFVADTGNNRVEVFTPEGRPLRAWGIDSALPGQFVRPLGLATAPSGQIMTVETLGSHSPLSTFSASFKHLHTWLKGGEVVLGHSWFSPTHAAFAPDGTVWVTDRENDLVRHLGRTGEFIGAIGAEGSGGGFLSEPAGVAVDASGDVYVADTGNHRIQKFAPNGRLLAIWHGSGASRLRRPSAIALDAEGDLYVVDEARDEVIEMSGKGATIGRFGGPGSGPGRFLRPAGIAVDSSGDVFVSDAALDRVQAFGPSGKLLSAWGEEGTSPGQMSAPDGLTVDCRGDLLLAEVGNNRISIFTHVAAPAVNCSK